MHHAYNKFYWQCNCSEGYFRKYLLGQLINTHSLAPNDAWHGQ